MFSVHNTDLLSSQEISQLLCRPSNEASNNKERVQEIIDNVRQIGDEALLALSEEIDDVKLQSVSVSQSEMDAAMDSADPRFIQALETAAKNIERYHSQTQSTEARTETTPGVICERISRPISRVGLYIPAGTAPLPSTALMLCVPAVLAGCSEIVVCTPPKSNGLADESVIAAIQLCGVRKIFKVGGAQAIAAMAYGTQSIPKVDKIFGPGNSWVTAAKQLVATDPQGAACDLPAGPSEVLVIADDQANPEFVASDLLSQAEHGPDSQVILITTSERVAQATRAAIDHQLEQIPRASIAKQALENSRCLMVPSIERAIELSNRYAPEHLIINVKNARDWLSEVSSAGSVFLGPWSPESIGDYCSGTNHVLPTYGYASAHSGLSLSSFQKQISVQELSATGLKNLGWVAQTLAEKEGLLAHANAVTIRINTLAQKP